MDFKNKLDVLLRDTERPGSRVNNTDLQIIATRFAFVEAFCHGADVVEFGPGSILGKDKVIGVSKSYTALELHPDSAQTLQKELEGRGRVLNEDCLASSLKSESCDVVMALAMIYYVDTEALIREALRLVKPRGKIIFCTPNKLQPNFQAAPGSIKYYTPKEIEEICKSYDTSVQLYGSYSFGNETIQNNLLKLNFRTNILRFLLKTLKTLSPKLYLYLRSMKFGTVVAIPQKLSDVVAFETPKELDIRSNHAYRMFYFVLEKASS